MDAAALGHFISAEAFFSSLLRREGHAGRIAAASLLPAIGRLLTEEGLLPEAALDCARRLETKSGARSGRAAARHNRRQSARPTPAVAGRAREL